MRECIEGDRFSESCKTESHARWGHRRRTNNLRPAPAVPPRTAGCWNTSSTTATRMPSPNS